MPALPPPITSRTNARVKALRQAFSGKATQPDELVGIEGLTLIGEAQRSGMSFDTLFVREGAEELVADQMLAQLRPKHSIVLSRDVFDSVVDTATPQPIAATVKISLRQGARLGPGCGTVLVLEDIQDPGNLGTLIRSAESFGVEEIFLSPGCANHWSPKVIRASAGSVFRQPVRRLPIAEALRLLREHHVHIAGAVAQAEDTTPSPRARLKAPVAVLIGNEGNGLSEQALAMVDERVNIPCFTESLNAAIAGSVLLYEAQRQSTPRVAEERATAEAAG